MINLIEARSLRKDPFSTSQLPTLPGIYAMYDHNHSLGLSRDLTANINLERVDFTKHVAYVGSSGNLRRRIRHHMIERNSSVVTGVSAVVLNPDKISHICWWYHEDFANTNRTTAAEIVAFRVFNPSLRSSAPVATAAQELLETPTFHNKMEELFNGVPTGIYYPMTFKNLAYWTQKTQRPNS